MNRDRAKEILSVYGRPAIKFENGNSLVFARQDESNIEEIEKLSTDELIQKWKNLVWMNCIYGQVSLNEMQRIDLIELEMNERQIEEDLPKWVEAKKKEFEINNPEE